MKRFIIKKQIFLHLLKFNYLRKCLRGDRRLGERFFFESFLHFTAYRVPDRERVRPTLLKQPMTLPRKSLYFYASFICLCFMYNQAVVRISPAHVTLMRSTAFRHSKAIRVW